MKIGRVRESENGFRIVRIYRNQSDRVLELINHDDFVFVFEVDWVNKNAPDNLTIPV